MEQENNPAQCGGDSTGIWPGWMAEIAPTRTLDAQCPPFGENIAYAPNLGTNAFQLLFDIFVTAIDVVYAVNDGFAIGHQRGQHERRRRPQIGGQYGSGA